jgi:aminomethyltransferase
MQVTVIGIVTSGTMSPSMNKGIGLGYVTIANTAVDSDIYIRIRKNDVLAKVVKLPFTKNLVSTKVQTLKF